MAQNLKDIEQTIKDLIQFTKNDLNRLKIESYFSYHCNVFAVYSNSALNIENSNIVKELNRKNKKTEQKLFSKYNPIDTFVEYLPKTINKSDDYIYYKVPDSLKSIVKRQLNILEERYNDYKKEEQEKIMVNFNKGPMAWTRMNIILPITGIFHSLINGEILYVRDEKDLKAELATRLDECDRDGLRNLKTVFTDLMIARYLRYDKECARIQKRE